MQLTSSRDSLEQGIKSLNADLRARRELENATVGNNSTGT